MSYYANGELKVVYLTADKSIPEKVENAFLYVNQRYDYDCDISDYTTTIEAWGNEPYSTETTEKLLELLTEIAPIKDGAEFDFCGEDRTYWRFIFENGQWKEQSGKIVYHDLSKRQEHCKEQCSCCSEFICFHYITSFLKLQQCSDSFHENFEIDLFA